MAERRNFPNRKLKRRQSALERRLKDVDLHSKSGNNVKMERAKSDVSTLKVKLGGTKNV